MTPTAKKEISKILDSVTYKDYYSVIRDFFELSAISIRNMVDYGKDRDAFEKRYFDIIKTYEKKHVEGFAHALGILGNEITGAVRGDFPFCDWSGELYMASGTSSKQAGQFFTPYSVSKIMAESSLNREFIEDKLGKDPDNVVTIYEPTCGAGGLIVAAIETIKQMGVNYAWNVFVDCGDIDSRCVHMTYVTLSLLGVPAVVRLGDALMMEYRQAWFTPACLMAWAHFNKRVGGGGYPKKATTTATEKATESHSKHEPKESHTEPQNTPKMPPKCNENGQLSLF